MDPDAKNIRKLLYVSDESTNQIYVYDYNTQRFVGAFGQFRLPAGQCVDGHGDIWVTEFDDTYVFEYAHGGDYPIKILRAGAAYSFGCSINPKNGDLAVANDGGSVSEPAQILIFKNAFGRPTAFKNVDCPAVSSPGYDDKGNLFVESGIPQAKSVCELPYDGTELAVEPINQVINSPGSVMWDGKYITLTDEEYEGSHITAIYQMREIKGALSLAGTVQLNVGSNSKEYISQPFIVGNINTPRNRTQGEAVVGSDLCCQSKVDFWAYPAGGAAFSLPTAPEEPMGQSVSIAP
jgi:hypothetical protein